jgi:hypothetical protein
MLASGTSIPVPNGILQNSGDVLPIGFTVMLYPLHKEQGVTVFKPPRRWSVPKVPLVKV